MNGTHVAGDIETSPLSCLAGTLTNIANTPAQTTWRSYSTASRSRVAHPSRDARQGVRHRADVSRKREGSGYRRYARARSARAAERSGSNRILARTTSSIAFRVNDSHTQECVSCAFSCRNTKMIREDCRASSTDSRHEDRLAKRDTGKERGEQQITTDVWHGMSRCPT